MRSPCSPAATPRPPPGWWRAARARSGRSPAAGRRLPHHVRLVELVAREAASIRPDPFPPRLRPFPGRRPGCPARPSPRSTAGSTRPTRRHSSRRFPTCRWCRSPTTSGGRSRGPTGRRRFTTVCRSTCTRSAKRPGTYLAFLGRVSPEKGLERPSRSPGWPACRCASPPRSTRKNGRTTSRRSAAVSSVALGRVRRRGRRRRPRTRSSATPGACCSRSTGPSRSAW